MEKIVAIQYLTWHFIDYPKAILKGWRNFLLFNLSYFSIPVLFKTFFSHWHRYYFSYGKGFSPSRYFEAFLGNLMSRIIGAIFRTFLIIAGVLVEILIFLGGAVIFFGWFVLPLILVFGFIFGLALLF